MLSNETMYARGQPGTFFPVTATLNPPAWSEGQEAPKNRVKKDVDRFFFELR
jgi:hypothetical protein